MKRFSALVFMALVLLVVSTGVQARKDDMDVARLTNSLNQLASDPTIGSYAQADQSLARDAINQLDQASSHDRPHALYIAEARVAQARAAAELQQTQTQLNQLSQQQSELVLERSRIDADSARRELDFQRMQYQISQEESARLQQQGQEAADQAAAARAEADQARKLAAAQSRVAAAAKREAQLAAKAAKAMRSQLQDSSTPSSTDGGGH